MLGFRFCVSQPHSALCQVMMWPYRLDLLLQVTAGKDQLRPTLSQFQRFMDALSTRVSFSDSTNSAPGRDI